MRDDDEKKVEETESTEGKKHGGVWLTVLMVVLALFILVLSTVMILLNTIYKRTNYVPDEKVTVDMTADVMDETLTTFSPEEESSIQEEMRITVGELKPEDLEGYYSILLIGADRRDKSWNGNSDAMILVTINNETKTLSLTSFMRDLYADIEGVGVRKLNHAYAIGAGPKLVETIEKNYGVSIDNYASVDFNDMIAIIDQIGGVDITIKDYELASMGRVGIDTPGLHHLNGQQALAYSRIRYQGRSDFERTQRQRVVLQAIMQTVRQMTLDELNAFVEVISPLLTHNMPSDVFFEQVSLIPTYLQYKVNEMRIPEDGTYHYSGEIIVPNDINAVIEDLRDKLYAQ